MRPKTIVSVALNSVGDADAEIQQFEGCAHDAFKWIVGALQGVSLRRRIDISIGKTSDEAMFGVLRQGRKVTEPPRQNTADVESIDELFADWLKPQDGDEEDGHQD